MNEALNKFEDQLQSQEEYFQEDHAPPEHEQIQHSSFVNMTETSKSKKHITEVKTALPYELHEQQIHHSSFMNMTETSKSNKHITEVKTTLPYELHEQ
jgi:hypothetical protein